MNNASAHAMRGKRTDAPRANRPFALWLPCSVLAFAIASAHLASATLNGTIDTYVGGGNGDGDAAINATIDPRGIALVGSPSAPNIYVADGLNHRVRRVDGSTGIITTIAGTGVAGFSGDGNQGQNAQLWLPLDVAVDSAGNVYIADTMNNRVRKVGTDGHISTFAGNGQPTYTGEGVATQVAVNSPYGVAVGPDGNIYIADYGNNRIRRVSPPGCVPSSCVTSTVAGTGAAGFSGDNGAATSAALRNPSDVTFDGAGNMYIADFGNNRVRRVVTGTGVITTVAGGGQYGPGGTIGDGGAGTSAVLNGPAQVDTDGNGNIYIADSVANRIRMLQANTFTISTVAGTGATGTDGDGGAAASATMYPPWGVAATTAGTFWLSQASSQAVSSFNRVRKVTAFGTIESVIGGGLDDGGAAPNALVDPHGGEAVDTGGVLPDLYFADSNNNVVRRVDGNTGIIYVIAGTGTKGYSGDGRAATTATLNGPLDVAVDSVNSLVYLADTANNVIRKIDRSGNISTVAGTGAYGFNNGVVATQTTLAAPRGIGLDSSGNLYIADHDNYRVRKLSGGQLTTVAGTGQFGSSGDGSLATSASLAPWDVVVARDGTLYISDHEFNRIRRVGTNGVISTYAGGFNSGYHGDGGLAVAATLFQPANLALDAAGNLFIADGLNNRIRRVDALALTIDTVAGNGGSTSTGDGGPAISASFGSPSGVAIDPSGSPLFIAASSSGRVRIVEFSGVSPPTPTFTPTRIPPTPTNASTPTRIPATATKTNTPGSTSVSISGRVTYYANSQVDVPAVQVGLFSLSGLGNQTVATDAAGNYSATVTSGGTWAVAASKPGGLGNGVSSLDAARVLQFVAGLTNLTPQQRLACDVTGDGTLSALDAQRILQFSAGLITQFAVAQACGSDWLFSPVPALIPGQQIAPPSVSGGRCQQGNIVLQGLNTPVTNQNFSAILFGDCTGNWTPSGGAALHLSARSAAAAPAATIVRAGALRRLPGHRVRLPIYVQGEASLQAFDVRIGYDASALTFNAATPHGAAAEALTGVNSGQPGLIGVSLASAKPIKSGKGAVLMLEFDRAGKTSGSGAQLLGAQVDEHSASVVNRTPR